MLNKILKYLSNDRPQQGKQIDYTYLYKYEECIKKYCPANQEG